MSVAPMGRRLIALLVDWLLCYLIASSIVGTTSFAGAATRTTSTPSARPCCCSSVEVYLLTAVSGLTVGKRLLGIRAIRTDGSAPGFKWAALRTAAAAVRRPGLPDRP